MATQDPAPPDVVKEEGKDEIMTDEVATEAGADQAQSDGLSADDLRIMKGIVDYLTDYKEADGYEPTAIFQRLPNKRLLPDYFDVIKEPKAFSSVRSSLIKKLYASWKDFVHDFAMIAHNAQVYNRPSAPVYKDAITLRELVKMELAKLVDKNIITAEDARLPDLGDLPPAEDSPPPGPVGGDVDEDDEDEDDEDEEDDESDDDRPKRGKGRRGKPPKREGSKLGDTKDDTDAHRVRGRPPKVHTPMEARINTLLKGLRRFKHSDGELKIFPFERLPDKSELPDYYQDVKNPIAMDLIKRKAKRKKYQSVDSVLKDLELMFNNAKEYNVEGSAIYNVAVELQNEARMLAEQEKNKPDSDFVDEDGRLPLSEIFHKGEMWKVGDWAHITNPNDLTKPIVAQIYRTWQDQDGQKWINACWYYRPEQTVHRYEKHFYENEVVKTGRYQDHHVDEIVDRCFVMFVTRYNKGRPRGFPGDKEVYVCEARYNEEKFKLNKIKTWASCVPDEVREKDYEMDLFDVPRKMRKVPSPIKHLLREDATEEDPLPKPTWGPSNAPPIVGAVHKRPREMNESPPPEPTPSPPPPSAVEVRPTTSSRPYDNQGDVNMTNTAARPSISTGHQHSGSYGQQFAPSRVSASPAPPLQHANSYGSQHSPAPQTPHYQQAMNNYQASYPAAQPIPTPNPLAHSSHGYNQQPHMPPAQSYAPATTSFRPSLSHSTSSGNAYVPPRPVEVYHLSDAANLVIPAEIRAQFHRDEFDRVLFFTAPPLNVSPIPSSTRKLGHSVRYLAKVARDEAAAAKAAKEDTKAVDQGVKRKRDDAASASDLEELKRLALDVLGQQLASGTDHMYRKLYGADWEEAKRVGQGRLNALQEETRAKAAAIAQHERDREASKLIKLSR